LHHPEVLPGGVGVLAPAQRLIEVLGPVHVSDRYHHDLELEVHDCCSSPADAGGAPPIYTHGTQRRSL
jgi:hypothetical protein